MTNKNDLQVLNFSDDERGQGFALVGPVDERALTFLPRLTAECRVLELSKLTRVSSAGAEMWMQWIRQNEAEKLQIVVQKLVPNFIRVLNSLPGLLPASWQIESFYVPHARVSNGASENVLFVRDRQFTKKELFLSPVISSPIDDQKLEIDVDPDRYFQFLRFRFPQIQINRV